MAYPSNGSRRFFAWHGTIRRFTEDVRGAVAIEFALVALPFFLIVANICEQGLIMVTEYSLQRGTENASRQIRTGQATDEADFRNAVCEAAVVVPLCERRVRIQVRNAAKFADLKTTVAGEIFEPGSSSSAVKVRVTYRWELLFFSFTSIISNTADDRAYRIAVTSVFRNEPF